MKVSKNEHTTSTGGGYRYDVPCKAGVFPCRVKEAEEGQSKSSGKQMITLKLQVDGSDGGTMLDQYVIADHWSVGNAVEALYPDQVAACEAGEDVELVAHELVGKECWVRVILEDEVDRVTREPTGEKRARANGLQATQKAAPRKPAAPTKPKPPAAPAKGGTDGW